MAESSDSGIYEIVNLVNGKRYVGSALKFAARWAKHLHALRHGFHHSKHLQSSFELYGEQNFQFRIIELCDRDILLQREQAHIDAGAHYNVCMIAGSPLGVKHSLESRLKMSKRRKGVPLTKEHVAAQAASLTRLHQDPEHRKKHALAITKSYTPELRQLRGDQARKRWEDPQFRESQSAKLRWGHDAKRKKLASDASKARWDNPEYRKRLKVAFSDRASPSVETREKIRQSLLGTHLSIETKRKKSALTDAQVSEVLRLRISGRKYHEIATEFGVACGCIARICKRQRYQWVDPHILPMIDVTRRRKPGIC